MIHIATVHWKTDQWIDIQIAYLKRYISQPFRIYGFLNDIAEHQYSKFHYVCHEPIEDHGIKLNLLANIISLKASEKDTLIFLDGDAFPVTPLDLFLEETFKNYPITAILRAESLADKQPHPSFLATTVGFWNKIKGDWKKGYCWQDSTGRWISDIGGNLLGLINENSIPWLPLYRSHSLTEHPLWYGIYNNLIYHHGAGFRDPLSRVDVIKLPFWIKWLTISISKSRSLEVVLTRFREKYLMRHVAQKQKPVHDEVHKEIIFNQEFFLPFHKKV